MEKFEVKLNQVERYDEIIANCLPDFGDGEIVTKDNGMESGRAIVMIAFTVQLPDGTTATAQTVTSVRMFLMAARILAAKYTGEGYKAADFDTPKKG